MTLPISVIILSFNEELNIGYSINSVINKFSQVIVVDSFSDDNTLNVCKQFSSVEIYQNKFIHWADQRNWALRNCKIDNEWVFFLDSDESINDSFFIEFSNKFSNKGELVKSFYLKKDFYFLGKRIRFAYKHPPIRLIFKHSNLIFFGEGAREYSSIDGESINIKTPLIHFDRRPFDFWVAKHIKNAEREKAYYFQKLNNINSTQNHLNYKTLSFPRIIRNVIWNKLPVGFRPLFNFTYRYFLKFGFLDGKEGFLYCVNQALWYESLIEIKIIEELQKNKI